MKRIALAVALAVAAVACGGDAGPSGSREPSPNASPMERATVDSTDSLKFTPKKVVLKAGGTVTWTNTGQIPHTVTFSGFDKPLKAGDEVQFTFTTAGTTKVRCTLHPIMTGEIVVV